MPIDDTRPTIQLDDLLHLLGHGELEVRGLLPGSSNYTFLADISNGRDQGLVVYKPSQGETPLWDFPHGTLCYRELAAYLISGALGWDLVPPTVMRQGPYGRGAVQVFVDADFQQHYFTLRDHPHLRSALRQIAAFDLVINNADRKGGHVLIDQVGRVWAIDHGVCFHAQSKLRTVIWEFAGQALPEDVRSDLVGLRAVLDSDCELYESLSQLLNKSEMKALVRRVDRFLSVGVFPEPDPYRRSYPWPLV